MPPTALMNVLESLRRRVRLLSVLYGVGLLIAVGAGLLLVTVLLDYLLNLPPVPRIVVMGAALVCLLQLLARWVVRPAMARLGLSDVAGRLEQAFPDFRDRLRSTVDFVTKGTPGSELMKSRVVAEATELAGRFDLNSAIQTKPVWESFAAGGGAIAVLIILGALVGSDYLSPAFSRLVNPFGVHPWPKRVEIEMVADLPARVPVGKPVDVRIRLIKGDRASREARVYYQYGDGRVESEIMTRGADGVYSASLDARLEAGANSGLMPVWIEAGDDSTPRRTVAIVQRLSVGSAQLVVHGPPYVKEAATTVEFDATPATVTYGSALTMKVMFNKELDPGKMAYISAGEQAGVLPQVAWDAPVGSTVVGHWVARESGTFQIHATDRDGFANADGADFQVIVRPDQMPSVQITRPARNEECTPEAVIPLRAVAEDDYAIKSLKLVVYRLGEKPSLISTIDLIAGEQPLNGLGWNRLESAGDRRRWQVDYAWDLAKLAAAAAALKPGDILEYHLEAQDNFEMEGKFHDVVSSGKYRIILMSQEQFSALMSDLVGQVREQIKDIRNTQKSLKGETEDLHHQTQAQAQFSRADRAQGQAVVARQATAASQAKQAAEKLDALLERMNENRSTAQDLKETAGHVRDDLNQVAEHPMKDAAAQVDDAKNQKSDAHDDAAKQRQQTDSRNAKLAMAEANQQEAADRLDQMISKMGDAGGLSQAIEKLHEILNQQQAISQKSNDVGIKNLGKRPDQMSDQDRKAQQANADAQAALAEKTSKAVEGMQKTAEQMQKTDPAASQAMKEAAQTGQQENVAAQMKAGSEAQKQNQQASAQQAQAQVEIGLQMMIHQLEEAQLRKLEALSKQLADIQEQINNLLRQQGGINYDNLALQGDAELKKIDAKVIDHLLELAERTKGHLPPTPDVDTQDRLQRQTERNTRGVSKSAESLPDGAAIVSDLNRAADRMGRAITALDDDADTPVVTGSRLAAAYDPPQVEALAALEKAKELIDQQAAKNNQALAQQKKDAIRAAYQKILEAQKKIDSDTAAIDKAPRLTDGQLGHRDAILLDQLPPREDGVTEQTAKLGDDLSGLNSIVYVWANKDIVDSMKSVRAELAKPQTDVVTRAEQTRIEEQIQAMIDSLSVKPKEIPFANKGGGKGSGSGQQPLPTEAELRLLKRLQEAVNKATVTISEKADKQDPALVALGGRQGQLRDLLDRLLQQSSHGHTKLGPEPDAKDKLPEEASAEKIDDQELTQNLLQGDGSPDPDQVKNDVDLIGQRMGRSRQRLALGHDPGKVTQEIQSRILKNMDALIDAARVQEAESKSQPDQQKPQNAQPQDAQANSQAHNNNPNGQQAQKAGTTPASVSMGGHDVDTTGTPTTDITQSLKEWGNLSPRQRSAVIEAASEKPVQKFKEFIDEYYQALGNRQAQ